MEKKLETNHLVQAEVNPGIQIIAENIPRYYSFSLGVFINHGSRDEIKEDNGITHLIEHMLFKGTSKKSALEIVRLIEGLGGSFDAFTTKENLVIVTKFLSEHLIKVADLIFEILLDSKIAEDDLRREKSVILEEIKSNNEDPSDYVFDLIFQAMFNTHSMALPITGTEDSIQNISLAVAHQYYQKILANRIIVAISGNYDYDSFFNFIQKRFVNHRLSVKPRTPPEPLSPRNIVSSRKDITQVHIVFGIPAVEYASKIRFHMVLLNTVFGGGMSSRLFQGLREQEGLVYDVHSFIDLYSDCGIFGFYFTCDKNKLNEVGRQLKTIFNEINQTGFEENEIEIAKTNVIGNLLLSLENSTNRMLRLGREMCYLDKIIPVDDAIMQIKAINVDEINRLITQYFNPQRYSISAVGPLNERELEEFANLVRG